MRQAPDDFYSRFSKAIETCKSTKCKKLIFHIENHEPNDLILKIPDDLWKLTHIEELSIIGIYKRGVVLI